MSEKPSGESKKSKPPIKTIAFVLLMLIAEAGVIIGAMMVFGQPADVRAEVPGLDAATLDAGESTSEIQLLHEKLTNSVSGRTVLYDTEILIVVKDKHRPEVEGIIESRRGAIRTGVSRIWSQAEHAYFSEPGKETLTRQTLEFIRDVVGPDPTGEPRVQSVLIPKSLGIPVDF